MLGLHRHAIQRLRLQDVFASRLFTGVSQKPFSIDWFVGEHRLTLLGKCIKIQLTDFSICIVFEDPPDA